MDFHSLSRKQLQALCKKNKIPANITNVAMADALAALPEVEGLDELLNPSAATPMVTPAAAARSRRKKQEDPPSDLLPYNTRRSVRLLEKDLSKFSLNCTPLFPSKPQPEAHLFLQPGHSLPPESNMDDQVGDTNKDSNFKLAGSSHPSVDAGSQVFEDNVADVPIEDPLMEVADATLNVEVPDAPCSFYDDPKEVDVLPFEASQDTIVEDADKAAAESDSIIGSVDLESISDHKEEEMEIKPEQLGAESEKFNDAPDVVSSDASSGALVDVTNGKESTEVKDVTIWEESNTLMDGTDAAIGNQEPRLCLCLCLSSEEDVPVQSLVSEPLKGNLHNTKATCDDLNTKSMGELRRMLKQLTLNDKSNIKPNAVKDVEKKRTALMELQQNRMTAAEEA
ncbi:hypothetical protein VNO78_05083 [Psophocarpus tetragonolobus]|uniref:Uncharacterized protein n=1 Tax=Psophocarpus tetragonolobus TaxID=3891 RepID=A0AAN9SQH9_PSOTE